MFQYGYCLASWDSINEVYSTYHKWGDRTDNLETIVTSVTVAGTAVGALGSGSVIWIGKRKCMLYTGFIVIVSNFLCLFPNWYCLVIGRFFYGICGGSYTVFGSRYISETAPTEIRGPAGSMTQISITFGILIALIVGVFFQ